MCQNCYAPLVASAGDPVWEDNGPPLMRPVPERSGEGAIYSPEFLGRREGNAYGTKPYAWRFVV